MDIVIPLQHFRSILRQLAITPTRHVRFPVSIDGDRHWLVRRSPSLPSSRAILFSATESVPDESRLLKPLEQETAIAHVAIGHGALEGKVWAEAINSAWQQTPGATATSLHSSQTRITRIKLPGSGMHQLDVSALGMLSVVRTVDARRDSADVVRWSRTIRALGLEPWRRLTGLSIAIVGCGRTGSLVAITLARMGLLSLLLVDPDIVEANNVGEMDGVNDGDIGRRKVDALRDFILTHCVGTNSQISVRTTGESVTNGIEPALDVDVIFCCADNDAARLACGVAATMFHKVLVDVGTGVLNNSSSTLISNSSVLTSGVDVRLILPNEGCLNCFGGLANLESALAEHSLRNQIPLRDRQHWWEQRNGSLRSLNMFAASLAVRLFEELLAERINSSVWLRAEFNSSSIATIENILRDTATEQQCPLCLRAGMGNDALARW